MGFFETGSYNLSQLKDLRITSDQIGKSQQNGGISFTSMPTESGILQKTFAKWEIRVALVESKPAVRKSWINRINFFPDFACSRARATGEGGLKNILFAQSDAALMDIILPQMSGIEKPIHPPGADAWNYEI
jgi:hypothetical protein